MSCTKGKKCWNEFLECEGVIVHKWRDWSLLGAQTFSPNEQEGKQQYIHADISSGQQELRRSILIVAISSKQKNTSATREDGSKIWIKTRSSEIVLWKSERGKG